jgi:endonuclease-3
MLAQLSELYDVQTPLSDPLHHILWENVGYLIDDDRRLVLFEEFRRQIGFEPREILQASDKQLLEIARKGGIGAESRVSRWREIAEIVQRDCDGDLAHHLRSLPLAKARAFLKRFPVIGDPGADKILLFCGLDAWPSVDSNGLRVLVRLGLVLQGPSYASTYKSAVGFLSKFPLLGRVWLMSSYAILREHGRTLCKRSEPRCVACPLDRACAHALAKGF